MKRMSVVRLSVMVACILSLAACEPSTPPPAQSSVAMSVASSEDRTIVEVAPQLPRKIIMAQPPAGLSQNWKDTLSAGCNDEMRALNIQHVDVNGDGVPDRVCWRATKSWEYGNFVDLVAQVQRPDGTEQQAYIVLAANGGKQAAICNIDNVALRQTQWTQQDFNNVGLRNAGPISLTLSDGACPPVWLFWPQGTADNEVTFTFLRK